MAKQPLLSLACVTFALACGPRALPPLEPGQVFGDLERELQSRYVFPLPPAALAAAYRAAGQAGPGGAADNRAALVQALNDVPQSERRAAIYNSLRGFLDALPTGTNEFVKPESLVWSRDSRRTAGVGLVLLPKPDGRFLVLDTLEGSASHRDGVRTGVYLKSVDDVSVQGLDREEVIGRIKGEPDTRVKLGLDYGEHSLVRGQVVFRNILNATWKTADGGEVEYIALRSTLPEGGGFAGTSRQLKELLIPMLSRRAVILDLRKLHLGDLTESFRVADLFVKEGSLGSILSKERGSETFTADTDQVYTGAMYVIVGRHSSPLAQTVAMAMRNSPNVRLVGAPTDGAAFLASSSEIAGGIVLRITTGYVLDAAGVPLFRRGLAVDVPVADILPQKPPLEKPDPLDPAQVGLAGILGVPLP